MSPTCTSKLARCTEGSMSPSIVSEIASLHGEILTAARTSLDKAIRIGELLVGIKGDLAHGQWLPWLKTNVPFAERTARNYMRCHVERDRLKTASVADLGEAYRLLAAPSEPTPPTDQGELSRTQSRFIPQPGTLLHLHGIANGARCWAIIAPAVQSGFCHIVFSSGDTDDQASECSAGLLEFTKKPVRADRVARALEYMLRCPLAQWQAQMQVDELDGEEPWSYNQFAYTSHQDYVDREILGKGRTAA